MVEKMVGETKCPGDELEELLLGLDPNFWVFTDLEPGRAETEKILKEIDPNVSQKEIEDTYKEHLECYYSDKIEETKMRRLLGKYGKNTREIREKLVNHFGKCEKCRGFYLMKLDEAAEAILKLRESRLRPSKEAYVELVRQQDFLKYLEH